MRGSLPASIEAQTRTLHASRVLDQRLVLHSYLSSCPSDSHTTGILPTHVQDQVARRRSPRSH